MYSRFAEAGLTDEVTFVGSGKLGLSDNAVAALALGCDMVNVAREPMLAVGCIQEQKCHTDRCPIGVATQNACSNEGWTSIEVGPCSELRAPGDAYRSQRSLDVGLPCHPQPVSPVCSKTVTAALRQGSRSARAAAPHVRLRPVRAGTRDLHHPAARRILWSLLPTPAAQPAPFTRCGHAVR